MSRWSKAEVNRIRRVRRAIVKAVKVIEEDDRWIKKPYSVARMLNWFLAFTVFHQKGSYTKNLYSKRDIMDIWELVNITEKRMKLANKNAQRSRS